MDASDAAVAPEGVDVSGAPQVLNEGDWVGAVEQSSPHRKRRKTVRVSSSSVVKKGTHRSSSQCPPEEHHNCQSLTGYFGGRCLVEELKDAGAKGWCL